MSVPLGTIRVTNASRHYISRPESIPASFFSAYSMGPWPSIEMGIKKVAVAREPGADGRMALAPPMILSAAGVRRPAKEHGVTRSA